MAALQFDIVRKPASFTPNVNEFWGKFRPSSTKCM